MKNEEYNLNNLKSSYKPNYADMKKKGFRAIPTEVLLAIIGSNLGGGELKVLLYLFHETYGFYMYRGNKHSFSYKDISEMTGVSTKQIGRIFTKLEERRIITKTREENKTIIQLHLSDYTRWDIGEEALVKVLAYLQKNEDNTDVPSQSETEKTVDKGYEGPRDIYVPSQSETEKTVDKDFMDMLDKL
jgi:phage replication O-like protein O